jgi:transposase-like protein
MLLNALVERLKRRSKDDFKGRHYEATLILQAVSWYLRYRNCSGRSDRLAHAVMGNGVPWSVRRMASMARIALRRAVSTTDRISA